MPVFTFADFIIFSLHWLNDWRRLAVIGAVALFIVAMRWFGKRPCPLLDDMPAEPKTREFVARTIAEGYAKQAQRRGRA